MIFIEYTPTKSKLVGNLSSAQLADLDNLCSFLMTGHLFSDKFLTGQWDGSRHYFSTKTQTFRSGLLSIVTKYLDESRLPYEIHNFPQIERLPQRGDYNLRPHQVQCLEKMFAYPRGIIQSPPRSGKTLIASAFIDQSRLFPLVFFCNSLDIASQTIETFKKYIPDVKIGFVGDGACDIQDITVATVQSAIAAYEVAYKTKYIKKRIAQGKAGGKGYVRIGTENELTAEQRQTFRKFIEGCKSAIYDECHHSQSATAVFVYERMSQAKIILGLSATPSYGRPEDMVIEATIGSVIAKISYHELIDAGWLLPPKIFVYKLPKTICSSNMYKTIYKEAITDNGFRNMLIARIANKLNSMGKTVLIVVDEIKHGNTLGKLYSSAIRLYGNADIDHRNDIKAKLTSGEIKCVISTLWDEGTDIPGLHYVINAAGGASPVSTFQRLRSITPDPNNPDKKFGGLIDFAQQEKHLSSHYKFRRKQYKTEPDFEIIDRDVSKWTINDLLKAFN